MATLVLQMAAVDTANSWTVTGGGSNKVTAVAQPDDDATSFITSGTTINTVQGFTITSATGTIGVSDTISNVAISSRTVRGASQSVTYTVSGTVSGTTSTGASQTAGAAYATVTDNFATQPNGSAWSLTALNSLIVKIQNTQARTMNCTSLYVTVTYTPFVALPANQLMLMGVGT